MQSKDVETQRSGFRIVYQILVTMCIVALIPIGGLWYNSVYLAKQNWEEAVFSGLASSAGSISQSVDNWTAANLRMLEQNSQTPALLSMDADEQNPVLTSISNQYSWVYLAFTILPDGQNLGRSDGQATRFYGDRDYFKQVMDGKALGQEVLLGKTSNKPAFILAKPIKKSGSEILGVIAVAMTLEDVSQIVTKTKLGSTGFATLLDEQNRLIASGDTNISFNLQNFSDHPALTQFRASPTGSYLFEDKGKRFVAHTKKTEQGWTLILQQDYDEAFAAANSAQKNALILLAATLLAVIVIAYLLASRLSSPLQNLTKIADEISRGNLEANIRETHRNDEIGALARAIERMGVSLQMAFARLRKGRE
ncbi:cache and HAMP domain-containing protein [Desulforhopalus sp. IMCC35007]|uniref:HAMP domain-containing protein n=1 Tax=Desulforhopalus sp. IMCC35007 TaxID=2569543 RepID=UPI00145E02D5|nr:cache and HAMP domain-containing protein [Desulforhopalus sp. IMCC35007]